MSDHKWGREVTRVSVFIPPLPHLKPGITSMSAIKGKLLNYNILLLFYFTYQFCMIYSAVSGKCYVTIPQKTLNFMQSPPTFRSFIFIMTLSYSIPPEAVNRVTISLFLWICKMIFNCPLLILRKDFHFQSNFTWQWTFKISDGHKAMTNFRYMCVSDSQKVDYLWHC